MELRLCVFLRLVLFSFLFPQFFDVFFSLLAVCCVVYCPFPSSLLICSPALCCCFCSISWKSVVC